MTGLRILLVEDEIHVANAMVNVLASRDHHVTFARSGEEALAAGRHDVLVADVGLGGISGLDVLEQLVLRGENPHAVVMSGLPDVQVCRRAMRLGAVDFLTKPFELDELVRAVESIRLPRRRRSGSYVRDYLAIRETVEVGAREIAAYAMRCGIGPTARARIASATAEALENVWRHAYARTPGSVRVEAVVEPREMRVTVRDEGMGFEPTEVGPDCLDDCETSGFMRMSALSENLHIESAPGAGTSVNMTFAVYRATFDEDGQFDMTELDWLTPETARTVLESMAERSEPSPFHLSPALAVSVGRLLSGPDPRRVLQTALWS